MQYNGNDNNKYNGMMMSIALLLLFLLQRGGGVSCKFYFIRFDGEETILLLLSFVRINVIAYCVMFMSLHFHSSFCHLIASFVISLALRGYSEFFKFICFDGISSLWL